MCCVKPDLFLQTLPHALQVLAIELMPVVVSGLIPCRGMAQLRIVEEGMPVTRSRELLQNSIDLHWLLSLEGR